MTPLPIFDRYQTIIDDPPAFEHALRTPPRRSIITNRLRISAKQLAKRLKTGGYDTEPLSWLSGGLRLKRSGVGLGRHWTYRAGLFNIQEASAMLPAYILSPRPGERILDLCAAPGNKTAQLSMAMENTGTIIANDPDYRRLRSVRMMIDRLGLINISTTCQDGTNYPLVAGRFDKVLVDAPCSCEGTFQKNPKASTCHTKHREKISRKQIALLKQAVQLCRPGGRIVYSTCTLAPEENEKVVQALLDIRPKVLRLHPIHLPGLHTSPGILTWAGQTFSPDLQHCVRIWPHHNRTDGFFIAHFEKTDEHCLVPNDSPIAAPDPLDAAWPQSTQQPLANSNDYLEYLNIRFGIPPRTLEHLALLKKKNRIIFAVAKGISPPVKPIPSMGLPLMHISGRFFKLTTAGAMAYGSFARRNIIDVNSHQLETYLSRRIITPTKEQARLCTGNGHVLIRYDGYVFGVGFYREEPSTIESFYPKAMSV